MKNSIALSSTQLKMLNTLAKTPDENAGDGLAKMMSKTDTQTSPMMQQLADVLARKRAQEQQELTEAAAEVIIDVINSADVAIERLRLTNADARRTAEAAVNKIEKIAVARVYGERTMNWLPLVTLLGSGDGYGTVDVGNTAEVPADEAKKILAEIKANRSAAKKTAAK